MSTFPTKSERSDSRRNRQRILDATAEAIAEDPNASLEQIAASAGVSRATLYHHFTSRDSLLDELTDRSIAEVTAALEDAHPRDGTPSEALERVLRAAWRVIGRYRGLVIVNQRLPRSELRGRLEPAISLIRELILRGQRSGEFDPELPAEWLMNALIDLIHAASRQVTAGSMNAASAERAMLKSATATLNSHRLVG